MSQNHYNGDIGVKINSHSFTKIHKRLHSTLSNTCLKPWPEYFHYFLGGLRVDILHTQDILGVSGAHQFRDWHNHIKDNLTSTGHVTFRNWFKIV